MINDKVTEVLKNRIKEKILRKLAAGRGLYFYIGPKHTPNPSPLRNNCVQEITHEKLMKFLENLH